MAGLFTAEYWPLWTIALALALFLPVSRLIWVLYVRRAERLGGGDAADRQRLKRRAAVTAALVCLAFAYLYTSYLFRGTP